MRHLMKLEAGRITASTLSDFLEARIKVRVEVLEDGFYRLSTVSERGRVFLSIGSRIANPEKQIEKWERSSTGRTLANSGRPGIAVPGSTRTTHHDMANLSEAAGNSKRKRSGELAEWLKAQGRRS